MDFKRNEPIEPKLLELSRAMRLCRSFYPFVRGLQENEIQRAAQSKESSPSSGTKRKRERWIQTQGHL